MYGVKLLEQKCPSSVSKGNHLDESLLTVLQITHGLGLRDGEYFTEEECHSLAVLFPESRYQKNPLMLVVKVLRPEFRQKEDESSEDWEKRLERLAKISIAMRKILEESFLDYHKEVFPNFYSPTGQFDYCALLHSGYDATVDLLIKACRVNKETSLCTRDTFLWNRIPDSEKQKSSGGDLGYGEGFLAGAQGFGSRVLGALIGLFAAIIKPGYVLILCGPILLTFVISCIVLALPPLQALTFLITAKMYGDITFGGVLIVASIISGAVSGVAFFSDILGFLGFPAKWLYFKITKWTNGQTSFRECMWEIFSAPFRFLIGLFFSNPVNCIYAGWKMGAKKSIKNFGRLFLGMQLESPVKRDCSTAPMSLSFFADISTLRGPKEFHSIVSDSIQDIIDKAEANKSLDDRMPNSHKGDGGYVQIIDVLGGCNPQAGGAARVVESTIDAHQAANSGTASTSYGTFEPVPQASGL